MIARRALLAAAALGTAKAARGQTTRPLVGFVGASSRQDRFERAFATGLRDAGFTLGREVDVEFSWTDGSRDPVRAIVAALLERRVAVIVTGGGNGARAARALTTSVPIVFATDADPVTNGLVASLARPGGNVTGLSTQANDLAAKRIEVLHELVPKAARIALIYSPGASAIASQRSELVVAARAIGAAISDHPVVTAAELDKAFADATGAHADAAIVVRDFLTEANRERIVALAAARRLPTVYDQGEFARAGGLASYGADFVDHYRRAAGLVARILRGAAPAELPVEQPARFEVVVNLRAARALGLAPSPALLAYADEVIE